MSWKKEIKKFDDDDDEPFDQEDFDRRMKERYEASLRDGGGVDENNPIHVEAEKIIKNYRYNKAEEIADRIKLRVKWLRKNAEYGGKD